MDWIKAHYTEQSRHFGRADITDQHRRIAERLHGWCQAIEGCHRVLELGAGACGVAGAMAQLGYEVTAVEFNPSDIAFARELKTKEGLDTLHIVDGDFYDVALKGRFDFVYYWDGFGVGQDADQRRLLSRVGREWLAEGGVAMIDVFSPWNWQKRDGERSRFTAADGSKWTRELRFDALGNRFRDFLRPEEGGEVLLSQTIRLYSLQEFLMLVEGTGLSVDAFFLPDGRSLRLDREDVELSKQLMETNGYYARLVRSSSA